MELGTATARYQYPGADAQFILYNFHSENEINQLVEILVSNQHGTPRVIELFGEPGSGRAYFVRAAAHHAWQRGVAVGVEELNLEGYEPDTSLPALLAFLATRSRLPSQFERFSELSRRVKIEAKTTLASFLIASIGVKADFSVGEILDLLNSGSRVPGPELSQQEALRRLLAARTQSQRYVLHISDANTAGLALIMQLIDETELNSDFFVSLALPSGSASPPKMHREHFSVQIPRWNEQEMRHLFGQRFRPNAIPSSFLDFAWQTEPAQHSRKHFASVLLRAVTIGSLTTDDKGVWRVDNDWQRNQHLLTEFSRDLRKPVVVDLRSHLIACGVPEDQVAKVFDFLDLAALCDPTIPIRPLLRIVGIPQPETEAFIDFLDDAFGADQVEGILEYSFNYPGFAPDELIYRFRNPVLPTALLEGNPKSRELAVKALEALSEEFFPDTRAIACLLLRLADIARKPFELEKYGTLLSYWCALDETEKLGQIVESQLKEFSISPALLWSVIELADDKWPPRRSLILVEAYGRQPNGVPLDKRIRYLCLLAKILYVCGDLRGAMAAAEDALSIDFGDSSWTNKLFLYGLMGLAKHTLGDFDRAIEWLESAVRIATANLPGNAPELATTLNNLAWLHVNRGNYSTALPLLEQALQIEEETLGSEHPHVAKTLGNLAALYHKVGCNREAEDLYCRCRATLENIFGPQHTSVAVTLDNLACVYRDQGRYPEAEELSKRALAIEEKLLGTDSPHTAITLANLALAYKAQEKNDAAEVAILRALKIAEATLGTDHPDTILIRAQATRSRK